MLKFKTYIKEEINYHNPKHDAEHDEVHTQLDVPKNTYPGHVHNQLKHLSNKKNFVSSMKNATTTYIHHTDKDLNKIGNTDVADKRGINKNPEIEKEKRDRVNKHWEEGKRGLRSIEKSIILHHKESGHKHLLAGNTRLTSGVQDHKLKVPVHTISY